MSATGLDVFDKSLQTTHIWLDEISKSLGPDRQLAWKVLSTVLHKLRDRLPVELAAHLGAELPLIVRGVYYDQFQPAKQPTSWDLDAFVDEVSRWLSDVRPVDPQAAIRAVFGVLSRHIPRGQIDNVQNALPGDLQSFWRSADERAVAPPAQHGRRGQQKTRSAGEQEKAMKASDMMTRSVHVANPNQTLQQAAQALAQLDAGSLPVGENDRLVGMITDRDIAIRGIAEGKGPSAHVREVMTNDVKYCFEDEDVDEIVGNMGDIKVRRLPVVNRDKRLVGILSLGDIATADGGIRTAAALNRISRPGGAHSQTG
jgi:uncharacterized protein (DUF2267 family)/CBS domain-containing protein